MDDLTKLKIKYADLIDQLNSLYWQAYDCHGRAIDEAIDLIRNHGIKDENLTITLLMLSEYKNEMGKGGVTDLVVAVTPRPKKNSIPDYNKKNITESKNTVLTPAQQKIYDQLETFGYEYSHTEKNGNIIFYKYERIGDSKIRNGKVELMPTGKLVFENNQFSQENPKHPDTKKNLHSEGPKPINRPASVGDRVTWQSGLSWHKGDATPEYRRLRGIVIDKEDDDTLVVELPNGNIASVKPDKVTNWGPKNRDFGPNATEKLGHNIADKHSDIVAEKTYKVTESITPTKPGYYIEDDNDKIIAGPFGEIAAERKKKELGCDDRGRCFRVVYVSDYDLRRKGIDIDSRYNDGNGDYFARRRLFDSSEFKSKDKTFLIERKEALLNRIINECEDIDEFYSGVLIYENKTTYYEMRKLLEYINKQVRNSTTKTVINELIKVLARLEYTNVRIPMTRGRISSSTPLLKKY